MTMQVAYDQVNAPTIQAGLSAMPAGSTLLKARLACFTWFSSRTSPATLQEAPPNTLLGISLRAAGTAPELITTANWKDATWYIAGVGELLAYDRWTEENDTVTPNVRNVEHTYSQVLELEQPIYNAASMSLGVALNFLGSGFFVNSNTYLSYQFTAWFD